MEELNKAQKITIPYRFKLLEMNLPDSIKGLAMRKVNVLRTMDASSGEYNKIKNWMDAFMSIPFNTYKKLNISMEDGDEKCQAYMSNAMSILDKCVYGLDDAKMQIIQMIGTWIANPDAVGNAVAIKGPPGTGKTTLVKEGISKILERPFEFIALGGSTDSSFLEGHSYTYEGSTWGKIASILMKSKCMNPIIYFDELDKVSETPKGEEIIGILTHLIDTSQNTQFHDKYFADIDFDLSKCLFIFSYNDENKVNPILRDRMYKIETKGYDGPQKLVITKDYLLPNIRKMINFKSEDIILDDEAINYIISQYTDNEKGVRNLKRCLEILYTKLNLYRLTNGNIDESIQKNLKLKKVSFPYTVTRECIETLIKPKEMNHAMFSLYS
jgi:ATP-dependent Lon protease